MPFPRSTASPFLDAESHHAPLATGESRGGVASPFLQAFALEDADSGVTEREGTRRILLAELHDEEFEEALYELAGDAARVARRVPAGAISTTALEQYLAPLQYELDTSLKRVRDRLGTRDPASIDEAELEDAFGDRGAAPLEPAMEQLFGGFKNVLKRAVKGAASLASKGLQAAVALGLGPVIDRLRKAIPGVLRKLVKLVIKRLPPSVQPHAQKLAAALGAGEVDPEQYAPAFDVSGIQEELDETVADALMGEEESALEEGESGWRSSYETGVGVADVDAARSRFMTELEQLPEGGDPYPAVERFVPALMPALMVAKRIVGRPKVVGLLSGMVAKLISRWVGPQPSQALSRALVDAGLKLVGFEVTPGGERHSASAAIAATVEETVRRVAALPGEELEHPQLAEGAILREFEGAAAANFPPLLPRAVYRQRPDLVETDQRRGAWVPCPVGSAAPRYKKYTQVIRTRITPRMAMAIPTFGGAPLGWFLQEALGLEPGEELEADVHLYEAMPGTLLPEIADLEGPGQSPGGEDEYHPLTPEAAALLAGEPGLGQEVRNHRGPARAIRVGQRVFRLAIPGRRLPGTPHHRRRTRLHLTLDFPGNLAVVTLYLGERRAQHLATALKSPGQARGVIARLRPVIDRLLDAVLTDQAGRRLRLIHEALLPAQSKGSGLLRVPAGMLRAVATKLGHAVSAGIAEFLEGQSAAFITATQDAKDGVTLRVTVTGLEGLAAMRAVIAGKGSASSAVSSSAAPQVKVTVMPGHVHD